MRRSIGLFRSLYSVGLTLLFLSLVTLQPAHAAGALHAGGISGLASRAVLGALPGPGEGMTLAELAAAAAAWVHAGLRAGAISPLAQQIFGEIGASIGQTAEWVAQNWTHIGPALQHAAHHLRFLAPGARFVLGRAASYAPTVLFFIVAAGLIPPAILQARLRALETEGRNEAREWQMEQAVLMDTFRTDRRDGLRVPSFRNTADIVLVGPGSNNVHEQLFQNYLNAAFVARRNPSEANIGRANTLFNLVNRVVSTPPEGGDNDW